MNNSFVDIKEKNKKDVFGAYLCEGIEYDIDNRFDIPYVGETNNIVLPTKLVAYGKASSEEDLHDKFIHFWQYDYTFDGYYGLWNSLVYDKQNKKGFNIDRFKNVGGIITPDFSVYYDMPEALRIYNTYRSRVVGYYFNSIGIPAIANVRWTDKDSYEYSFAGLRFNEIVAVSTLGCLRNTDDKILFLEGLEELIIRIRPKTIIIYGSLIKEIREILVKYNQEYIFFESEISKAYRGNR